MKKSFTLLITLFTIVFVSFAIISFMNYFSLNKNTQYTKDLAELRGYWGAYGARKEYQTVTYFYKDSTVSNSLYNINSFNNGKIFSPGYSYSITSTTNLENKDINIRTIFVDSLNYNNNILRYSKD